MAVASSPDGSWSICGCRDGTVRITNISTLQTLAHVVNADAWVNCVAVHPREFTAVAGDSSGRLTKVSFAND